MRVHEVMTPDVHAVQPEATIQDAAGLMRSFDVGSLPVCAGSKLIGIITDRDITVRITAAGLSPVATNVIDAMTDDVRCCHQNDDVEIAAKLMEELQVRRLPVVDEEQHMVGVISLADIAERIHDRKLVGEVLEQVCEQPAEVPMD